MWVARTVEAMAYTQADLDAIKAAIATGAKKVKFRDKEVEYNSIEELLQAQAAIESELGQSVSTRRPSRLFGNFGKGTQ